MVYDIFFNVVLYFFVQHRLTQTLMSLTENKHIVIRKAISFVFGVILSFLWKKEEDSAHLIQSITADVQFK